MACIGAQSRKAGRFDLGTRGRSWLWRGSAEPGDLPAEPDGRGPRGRPFLASRKRRRGDRAAPRLHGRRPRGRAHAAKFGLSPAPGHGIATR
jgi:hypothetical protein